MDISYLLWLQGIRESAPVWVEQFFVVVSAIAASSALIVLPCLLYWCLDKRAGQTVLFSFTLGTLSNQLIKNTVCCYRPWIRSAEIHPAEGALAEATGYSFPSGHTQSATSVIGSTGWYYRRRWPVLCVLCWLFVLLVGFSRNFLGVHTPQDVVVGLVEGIVMIALAGWMLRWVDARGGRDVAIFVLALVACAGYVAYIYLKPYPVDYDAAGAVLVDPVAMQVDCFKSGGVFLGAFLGWFLERRTLSFEVSPREAGWKRMVVRFALGMAAVAVLHLAPRLLLLVHLDERWYELVKNFLTVLGAVYVGPLLFCAVERRTQPAARRGKHFAR